MRASRSASCSQPVSARRSSSRAGIPLGKSALSKASRSTPATAPLVARRLPVPVRAVVKDVVGEAGHGRLRFTGYGLAAGPVILIPDIRHALEVGILCPQDRSLSPCGCQNDAIRQGEPLLDTEPGGSHSQ